VQSAASSRFWQGLKSAAVGSFSRMRTALRSAWRFSLRSSDMAAINAETSGGSSRKFCTALATCTGEAAVSSAAEEPSAALAAPAGCTVVLGSNPVSDAVLAGALGAVTTGQPARHTPFMYTVTALPAG